MNNEIRIIRQTENDLAVFKPKGIATELSNDTKGTSLISKVEKMVALPEKPKLPHRLDRITSGLVLLTISDEALRYYNEEIKSGLWEKYYLARIVLDKEKKPESLLGVQKAYLKEKDGRSFAVKSGGKPSFMEILSLEHSPQNDGSGFVLIKLLTGRLHQIRVMMENLGFPLTGDFIYNSGDKRFSEDDFYLEHILLKYRDFTTGEALSLYCEDSISAIQVKSASDKLAEILALSRK